MDINKIVPGYIDERTEKIEDLRSILDFGKAIILIYKGGSVIINKFRVNNNCSMNHKEYNYSVVLYDNIIYEWWEGKRNFYYCCTDITGNNFTECAESFDKKYTNDPLILLNRTVPGNLDMSKVNFGKELMPKVARGIKRIVGYSDLVILFVQN